jgi:chromosome segregation ATPase
MSEMDDVKRQLGRARQELDAAERIRPTLEAKSSEMESLRRQLQEATQERDSAEQIRLTLESKLRELEDENLVLEQALEEAQTTAEDARAAAEDARAAAEQSAAAQQAAFQRYKQKLEKYKRERDELASTLRDQHNNSTHSSVSEMAAEERRDLHKMLRESQLEADKLDRELRQHREALEELMGVESTLRKKLERARSERAAYRASAEKLQEDFKKLEVEKDKALAEAEAATAAAAAATVNGDRALVHVSRTNKHGVDTDAIIRAAEAAEKRHEKEIRGMVMQLEWLKACWDREARLRNDVAYAKRYLTMEVQIRDAWYVVSSPTYLLTGFS